MTDRAALIERFLASNGWDDGARGPLADDASFRRYERLTRGEERAVLMDAPPPQEDVRPFVAVAEILQGLGFSAPEIRARDVESGLLLLEDLGDRTYTRVLADGGDEEALYTLAVDVLIELHRRFDPVAADLPNYDDARLLDEAALLTDWYLPAVTGSTVPATARDAYLDLWRLAFAVARAVPSSLVLRDFHVDNLMLLDDRPDVRACGLLDFQDAVIGPVTYDLASLFEDARRDVPADLASRLMDRYCAAFPSLDRAAVEASYAVLAAQRSAKILGIFTRLDRRDGKPVYLEHIPRVWRWLEGDLGHPALTALKAWFDDALPPPVRRTPAPRGDG